jgi:signal transduction histidine kinase
MNTTPTTLWRLDTSSDPALDSILRCVIAAQGCPTARIHWFESQYIHLSRLIGFQVRKGADHVLNLVSDILELSRTEQGTRC